jgi:hypothetical protein
MDDISYTLHRQQWCYFFSILLRITTRYLQKPHSVRHPRIQEDGIEEIFPAYPRGLAGLAQLQRLQIKALLYDSK